MPFLSIKDAMDEWTIWNGIEEEGFASLDTAIISLPSEAIKEKYANRYYVPISKDFGGNNVGIDLDPDTLGTLGQVINFGRDEEMRYVIATSITEFLKFMLTHIQSGNFVIVEEDSVKSWRLKHPENSHFFDTLKDLNLPFGAATRDESQPVDAHDYSTWVAGLSVAWKEIVKNALRPGTSGFAALSNVKTLRFIRKEISDLSPMARFPGLRELVVSVNPIRDIMPLRHLPELKKLFLSRTLVRDIQPLRELSKLKYLNLNGLTLDDISCLKSLKKLNSLGLEGCTLPNLETVSQLKYLTELDISNAHFPEFTNLQKLENLKELNLAGTNITDLSFIAQLKKLAALNIYNVQVKDYSVLGKLPRLGKVTCGIAEFLIIKDILPRKIQFAISGAMTKAQQIAYEEYVMSP